MSERAEAGQVFIDGASIQGDHLGSSRSAMGSDQTVGYGLFRHAQAGHHAGISSLVRPGACSTPSDSQLVQADWRFSSRAGCRRACARSRQASSQRILAGSRHGLALPSSPTALAEISTRMYVPAAEGKSTGAATEPLQRS